MTGLRFCEKQYETETLSAANLNFKCLSLTGYAHGTCKLFCSDKKNHFNPSPPDPGRREKINLYFNFHSSLWCLRPS